MPTSKRSARKTTTISRPERQPVELRLLDYGGDDLLTTGRVTLTGTRSRSTLKQVRGSNVWRTMALPGTYRLSARVGGLVAPPQTVEVGPEGYRGVVYLGEAGWPFYRMGETPIPFPPRDPILAIVPTPDVTARTLGLRIDKALAHIKRPLMSARALAQLGHGAAAPADGPASEIRLVNSRATAGSPQLARLRTLLEKDLGKAATVGTPVDLRPGRVKVITGEFIVRFKQDVSATRAESLIESSGATIVRSMVQAPKTYLIRFAGGSPFEHLERIERWHQQGLLVYGEPDLVTEMQDDVFPYTDPDDPTYTNQANLTLQRVDEAWRLLARIDPKLAMGSPRVYIATLDRGIDTDHPDLGGTLTDGSAQMSACFDFSGMRACTVTGYLPDTNHGMGVYGIVAAATDNAEDIAGIASNTHHIGLERPSLTSSRYADVLLWAAGFVTGNTTGGWPTEPLRPAADIISCSHGSDGLALSGTMNDTLSTLANDGRGGLGTVVVYSAGNSGVSITGFRTWAAHPGTIAVSNSRQPNAAGVETLDPTSNFGPEIDVCAQGTGAPSLNHTGGEQTFGGTSAAAPTVAAVAGLILSVDPTLTAAQVRAIIRETAVPIDTANTNPNGQWSNGFSQWYGHGRIDAAQAVARAVPHRGDLDTDFDADRSAEIPVSSPWGIGILDYSRGRLSSQAMAPNGTRIGGWLLNTRDNRFDVMADLDGDSAAELLVSSPWGIGVLNRSGSGYSATTIRPNGTRFGGWLLNTRDNRFGPAGDFDGDGRVELMVGSPWGVGILKLAGATFQNPLIEPNGTRFGGWLLNTRDNRFGPVGDFDGDGRQEILVTSPWGVGILKLSGSTFQNPLIRPNGSRFNGWLLNTDDNRFGLVGDFDGDGVDEILVTSPWGLAILKLSGRTFSAIVIQPNGTRFGGWLLNTGENRFLGAADFDGDGPDEIFVTSPWGIGILKLSGSTLDASAMAPNGSRFNGWLLNTRDNSCHGFADMTGNRRANALLSSPWGLGILAQRGTSFSVPFMAPNGTRFGGWLLNTGDNRFY